MHVYLRLTFCFALVLVTIRCAEVESVSGTSNFEGDDLKAASFFEAKKQVNDCQWKLLQKYPQHLLFSVSCFKSAEAKTSSRFESGHWNGNSNAFKHSLASACLAQRTGVDFAKAMSTAHELLYCGGSPDQIINSRNDLANNSFGIRLVQSSPSASLAALEQNIIDAICSGELTQVRYRNDGTAQIVPTDCSEQKGSKSRIAVAESKADKGQCEYLEVGGVHVGFPGELRFDSSRSENPIGDQMGAVGSGIPLRMQRTGAVVRLNGEDWLLVNVRGGALANKIGWMRRAHLRPRHGVCLP